MNAVDIVPVEGRRMLKQFIRFPFDLFKDCPHWVPSFEDDELKSLGDQNPSLSFCERELYLAKRDGKIVGRVAAIINHKANDKWKENTVRFGWIDFVEDFDVAKALLDAVVAWGKARGATKVKGPLGFTDMDREGLLVEGFEHDSPFTVIYNFPYYGEFLERMGFRKDVDWTQRIVELPDTLPPMFQYADLVEKRYGLHLYRASTLRQMARRGREMFHVLNESFAPLERRGQARGLHRHDAAHLPGRPQGQGPPLPLRIHSHPAVPPPQRHHRGAPHRRSPGISGKRCERADVQVHP